MEKKVEIGKARPAPEPDAESAPVLMVFLYRAFDLRFMVSAEVIEHLSRCVKVVLVVPEPMFSGLRDVVPTDVVLEAFKYPSQDFVIEPPRRNRFVRVARSVLSMAFSLTYGNLEKKPNATHSLHVRNFRKLIRSEAAKERITRGAALFLSQIAVRSRAVRRAFQQCYKILTTEDAHRELYERHRPDLVAVCSLGLSSDGTVLCEAQRHRARTVCVVQSWDKTSSKGYPQVTPDYVVVWSNVMAEETTSYFDIPEERVFVEGAPVWDSYFQDLPEIPRSELLRGLGLPDTGRLIYCALNSPGYHDGNKNLAELLSSRLQEDVFGPDALLLFRLHPGYMSDAARRDDLIRFLDCCRASDRIAYCEPKVEQHPGFYLFLKEDDRFIRSIFRAADVCLSVGSTQMIEASVFDKPAICVEYGRWHSRTMELDFSDYKLEHRERVFRCGAVERAADENMLIRQILEALAHPGRRELERQKVVAQEIPVNRGTAAQAIARRILQLAQPEREG